MDYRILSVIWAIGGILSACSAHVPALMDDSGVSGPIVVGRTIVVLTGELSRRYAPKVRFIEIENLQTDRRITVDIDSHDTHFALPLPVGDYRVNRVQVSEGPFMSMADVASSFSVGTEPVTYVGTWLFGVDSPRYGRRVAVSMVLDDDERPRIQDLFTEQYPDLVHQPMAEVLPQPAHIETRLYEVMPYPRYPRYFRRHFW
jgi:hypothetical protein